MKKLFSVLIGLLMFANINVFASDIEVQPTMQSRSNAQDRVWVGTFQIVWNDFIDKIVHNPVKFREGTPTIAKELNKRTFSITQLSDKCYYRYVGQVKKNTKKTIVKALQKRFNETSDIIDQLDLTPAKNKFLVYAMLKKDFEFTNEFDKLGVSRFGSDMSAEYFGIQNSSDNSIREGVEVLFYNSPEDYAVKLSTKSLDEVYLYKNSSNKAFSDIYSDMSKKAGAFEAAEGDKVFQDRDELKVPNISMFEEKHFDELTNKRIMGTNLYIEDAMETIKFDMDNKGVKLKSEAAIIAKMTCLLPDNEPRRFFFDDTFVIFLKEQGKSKPYFALRVHDISKFQK